MTATRALLSGVLLLTAFLVQSTALVRLGLPGATPDLMLLVVVALALAWGAEAGALTGFAAGLLVDLAPPADGPLARWTFALTLVGCAVGSFTQDAERSLLVPLGAVAAAAGVAGLVVAAVGALVGEPGTSWSRVFTSVPSAVLYDVVLSPFVLPVVLALARRTDPEHDRHSAAVSSKSHGSHGPHR